MLPKPIVFAACGGVGTRIYIEFLRLWSNHPMQQARVRSMTILNILESQSGTRDTGNC
jgi:hypothetical protein